MRSIPTWGIAVLVAVLVAAFLVGNYFLGRGCVGMLVITAMQSTTASFLLVGIPAFAAQKGFVAAGNVGAARVAVGAGTFVDLVGLAACADSEAEVC